MRKSEDKSKDLHKLRKRAEAALKGKSPLPRSLSNDEMEIVLEELRTHQIKLEMQNEDLRRAQEELVESRNRYSDLYDFAPVGYVTLTEKCLICDTNLTFADMLGVEKKSLVNRPLSKFILNEDQDAFCLYRKNLIETKKRQACELRMRKEDGSPFWVGMESGLVEDADGDRIQLRCAVSDITERKRLEEQLRQAQKMEAVGQLSAGIAHNINNQLMAIVGNLSLAKEHAPEELLEYFEEMNFAANRTASLVQQLLAYGRKKAIRRQAADLNKIVRDACRLARDTIDRRIGITVQTESGIPKIKADAPQIEAVLMNLCVNAREAIKEVMDGKVAPERQEEDFTITLKTETAVVDQAYCDTRTYAHPGRFAVLSISDNGCGMDLETQGHVFDPFFTTKDSLRVQGWIWRAPAGLSGNTTVGSKS
ncbi:MAG: PAS domain S-box protein [bacterium]